MFFVVRDERKLGSLNYVVEHAGTTGIKIPKLKKQGQVCIIIEGKMSFATFDT